MLRNFFGWNLAWKKQSPGLSAAQHMGCVPCQLSHPVCSALPDGAVGAGAVASGEWTVLVLDSQAH